MRWYNKDRKIKQGDLMTILIVTVILFLIAILIGIIKTLKKYSENVDVIKDLEISIKILYSLAFILVVLKYIKL